MTLKGSKGMKNLHERKNIINTIKEEISNNLYH